MDKVDYKKYNSLLSIDYFYNILQRSILKYIKIFKKQFFVNTVLLAIFFVILFSINFLFDYFLNLLVNNESTFLLKDVIVFLQRLLTYLLFLSFLAYRHLNILFLMQNNEIEIRDIFKFSRYNFKNYLILLLSLLLIVSACFLLFFVPGIVVSVMLVFAPIVMIFKNKKISKSLKESKKVVDYFWWETFGHMNLFLLLYLFLTTIVFYSAQLGGVFTQLVGVYILTPFIFIYLTNLYNDYLHYITSDFEYELKVTLWQKSIVLTSFVVIFITFFSQIYIKSIYRLLLMLLNNNI